MSLVITSVEEFVASLNPHRQLSGRRDTPFGYLSFEMSYSDPTERVELPSDLIDVVKDPSVFSWRTVTVLVEAYTKDEFIGKATVTWKVLRADFATTKYVERWHYAKAFDAEKKAKALGYRTRVTGDDVGTKRGAVWLFLWRDGDVDLGEVSKLWAKAAAAVAGSALSPLESEAEELRKRIAEKEKELLELQKRLEEVETKLRLEKMKSALLDSGGNTMSR